MILRTRPGLAPALLVVAGLAALSAGGCGPKEAAIPVTNTGPKVIAPPANPNSKIGENNPPPGQPNHMSPEMQAQMERYRAAGKGGK